MLVGRTRDGAFYPQPVSHQIHFPEGHARLSHSPRSRIHAEENDSLWRRTIPLEVLRVRVPGILQGVVDVGDGWTEFERGHFPAELPRNTYNPPPPATHCSETTSEDNARKRSTSSCVR